MADGEKVAGVCAADSDPAAVRERMRSEMKRSREAARAAVKGRIRTARGARFAQDDYEVAPNPDDRPASPKTTTPLTDEQMRRYIQRFGVARLSRPLRRLRRRLAPSPFRLDAVTVDATPLQPTALVCPPWLNPARPPNMISSQRLDERFHAAYSSATDARAITAALAADHKQLSGDVQDQQLLGDVHDQQHPGASGCKEMKGGGFAHGVSVNAIVAAINAYDRRALPRCRVVIGLGAASQCAETFAAIAEHAIPHLDGVGPRRVLTFTDSPENAAATANDGHVVLANVSARDEVAADQWARALRTPHAPHSLPGRNGLDGVLFLLVDMAQSDLPEHETLTTISWNVMCGRVGGARIMHGAMVPRLLSLCQGGTVFIAISPKKPETTLEVQPSVVFVAALAEPNALFYRAK